MADCCFPADFSPLRTPSSERMSSGTSNLSSGGPASELRERKKASDTSADVNASTVGSPSEDEQRKDTTTWGRTPDGTGTFIPSSIVYS